MPFDELLIVKPRTSLSRDADGFLPLLNCISVGSLEEPLLALTPAFAVEESGVFPSSSPPSLEASGFVILGLPEIAPVAAPVMFSLLPGLACYFASPSFPAD